MENHENGPVKLTREEPRSSASNPPRRALGGVDSTATSGAFSGGF